MKETKDNDLFEIDSVEEMNEWKKIATGRRFFKIGERVIDICRQEIERYQYEHAGFFTHLLKKSKYNNKNEKYMLENHISSIVRAVASYCIRRDEENEELILNSQNITTEVREYIYNIVEEYEKKNKEKNKVIDIKSKVKKEA